MSRTVRSVVPLLLALFAACDSPTNGVLEQSVEFDLTRAVGADGWQSGFADYPVEAEASMNLVAGHDPLPSGLSLQGAGLRSAGTNHSDDLFMFWKRRVSGLRPSARYNVEFMVEFATRAPSGCVGTGGAPGESVYLKAGAAGSEPAPVVEQEGGVATRRMNVDKGNQAQGGPAGEVLGHIGGSSTDCDNAGWEVRRLESPAGITATTGTEGELWLLVGTDSGFEGRTEVYYTRLRARFRPI